ncbi:DUF4306 domain-containing protein [Peribacillus sp. NPDC096447]|uniref:DUF4306 domain-containing protein n=1 Tax=Peribacillus sp. NPDC096447 TaxID=3364394 RepID=UPI00382E7EE4
MGPREWKYSTHFTQVNDDQAMDADDISSFDYFVYAAKFKPLFPLLMVLAASYFIILTGYILFKRSIKGMSLFLLGLGFLFLLLSGFVSNSPTVGGNIFQAFYLIGGRIAILSGALLPDAKRIQYVHEVSKAADEAAFFLWKDDTK